ncbi:MAG: PspA/IM30 family protein [Candidatus Wallbacteria bacterium]|nr:PspA/IM30 family protein [Candidatus Wallbacteria bacterium]MBI4866497.1 PspA/IM30 family protein [Candidatus Wallbacteria bacterium]
MGLFARLGRMLRSNVNSMLDAAENPEKTLEQLIRDMEENYRQAKEQVTQAMVDERRIQKKVAELKEEAASWKSKAQFAVGKGDDALAKAALVRFKASQDLVDQYDKEQQRQAQAVESLKQALTTLENKIEEAKRKKKELITRKRIAETKMQLSTTANEVKETDAFAEFDRIATKIEDMELKSGVMLELSADPLKSEVKLLEGASEVDVELAKLKAEMGVDGKGGA